MNPNNAQKIYYNCEIVNQTGQNIEAQYTAPLGAPLIDNPSEYNINVNRFRLPLNGIPLTENNIPFEQLRVALGYTQGGKTQYTKEYVPQYGGIQQTVNNLILYKDGTNNIYLVKTPNTGSYNPLDVYSIGNFSGIPIFQANLNFIMVAIQGSKNIYVLNLDFNEVDTITTSHNILGLCMDSATNDFYYIRETTPMSIVQYTYAGVNAWNAGHTFTSTTFNINDPRSICFVGGVVYVSNYTDGTVYSWSASTPGEPTGFISSTQPYMFPTVCANVNNSLTIAYDCKETTVDIVYGLSKNAPVGQNQTYYNLLQGETQATSSNMQMGTQVVQLGDIYMFAGNSSSFATFALQSPFISNNWYSVNGTTAIKTLGSQNDNTLFATDNALLYGWNATQANNTYSLLSNQFLTVPASLNNYVTSFDFMQGTGKMICTDTLLNTYMSNNAIYQRNFLVPSSTPNTLLFYGSNFNNNLYSATQISSHSVSTIATYCFDGTYYYVVNPQGTIDKYDDSFNFLSNFPCTECGNVIFKIEVSSNLSGTNSSAFFCLTPTSVVMYKTTDGTLIQSIALNVNLNNFTLIRNQSGQDQYLLGYLDYIESSFTLHVYDIVQNSSVGNFAITNSQRIVDFTAVENSGALTFYCITNNSTSVNGVNYLVISLPSILGQPTQSITLNKFTTPQTNIYHNPNLGEFYCQDINGNLNVAIDSNLNFSGSINLQIPINRRIIVFPLLPSTLAKFTQITCNKQLLSVCASNVTNNLVYAVANDNLVYSGTLSNNSVTLARVDTVLQEYTQISTHSEQVIPPSTNNAIRVHAQSDTIYDSTTSNISFIGNDQNNNIVFSSTSTPSLLYTLSNGIITNSTYIANLYGSSPFKPEYQQVNGTYNLWTYQDYLQQMNLALSIAFSRLKALYPNMTETDPPEIFFDPASKLFYLMVQQQYMTGLLKVCMNSNLDNMFQFPSIPNTDLLGYRQLLMLDGTSGTSQSFISIYQQSSSIAKFYDLVRIIVSTNSIPVMGDLEGIDQQQSLITDVVPDVDTLSPNGLLIYQPTVLRWYNLYSQNPLKNMNISFWYGTRDGSIRKVMLPNNEYASCKLEFEYIEL